MSKSRSTKYIKTNVLATCFYLLYKIFFKEQKKVVELVSLAHFLHDFWRKMFSLNNLLPDQISLPDCLYFLIC